MVIWSEEKLAELKALIKSGIAYSKIAARLSAAWKIRVTKNMVSGAANRQGWMSQRVRKPRLVAREAAPPKQPKKQKFVPVIEAARGSCLFIHGEPKDREFCGKPAVRDTGIPHAAPVWCAEHLRIVYVARNLIRRKVASRQGKYVVWETSHVKTDGTR